MNTKGAPVLYDGKPAKRQRTKGPPRGRPTREQSERRNRQLLDRALDLFLKRGFDGVSIEAIVDSLGMARRTVYARYGDKLTLFKAALQGAIDELVIPAERLLAAEVDDLEATLLNVATLILKQMRSTSGLRLNRIANAEMFKIPEIASYLWERTGNVTITYLTDLFNRRCLRESASDAALAFYLLVIEGSFRAGIWYNLQQDEFERQVRFRLRLFLRGSTAC